MKTTTNPIAELARLRSSQIDEIDVNTLREDLKAIEQLRNKSGALLDEEARIDIAKRLSLCTSALRDELTINDLNSLTKMVSELFTQSLASVAYTKVFGSGKVINFTPEQQLISHIILADLSDSFCRVIHRKLMDKQYDLVDREQGATPTTITSNQVRERQVLLNKYGQVIEKLEENIEKINDDLGKIPNTKYREELRLRIDKYGKVEDLFLTAIAHHNSQEAARGEINTNIDALRKRGVTSAELGLTDEDLTTILLANAVLKYIGLENIEVTGERNGQFKQLNFIGSNLTRTLDILHENPYLEATAEPEIIIDQSLRQYVEGRISGSQIHQSDVMDAAAVQSLPILFLTPTVRQDRRGNFVGCDAFNAVIRAADKVSAKQIISFVNCGNHWEVINHSRKDKEWETPIRMKCPEDGACGVHAFVRAVFASKSPELLKMTEQHRLHPRIYHAVHKLTRREFLQADEREALTKLLPSKKTLFLSGLPNLEKQEDLITSIKGALVRQVVDFTIEVLSRSSERDSKLLVGKLAALRENPFNQDNWVEAPDLTRIFKAVGINCFNENNISSEKSRNLEFQERAKTIINNLNENKEGERGLLVRFFVSQKTKDEEVANSLKESGVNDGAIEGILALKKLMETPSTTAGKETASQISPSRTTSNSVDL